MKKIFLTLLAVLIWAGWAWGAAHYIDKRNTYNGDGSLPTPATTVGSPGAWNSVKEACYKNYVATGDTVYFVKNSGPYYKSDFVFSVSVGTLYPFFDPGAVITYDFGGNVITFELNLSSGYEWHETTYSGDIVYYATAIGGGNPNIPTCFSGIVDGVWDAESTSLFGASVNITEYTHTKKWGYGNKDSLGFNTVYVRGVDPITGSPSILMSTTGGSPITITRAGVTYIFKNGVIRGGGGLAVTSAASNGDNIIYFKNIEFINTGSAAIRSNDELHLSYCKFKDCGHEAFDMLDSDAVVSNCHFENVHLITKLVDATSNTVTVKNCSSYNLLAGAFMHDSATQILIEDYNQFHLDLINIHGGDALAYTAGTRQWTETGEHDFPASTATTETTSVLPTQAILQDNGIEIPGVNIRDILDFYGNYPSGPVDIGLKQTFGRPRRPTGPLMIP